MPVSRASSSSSGRDRQRVAQRRGGDLRSAGRRGRARRLTRSGRDLDREPVAVPARRRHELVDRASARSGSTSGCRPGGRAEVAIRSPPRHLALPARDRLDEVLEPGRPRRRGAPAPRPRPGAGRPSGAAQRRARGCAAHRVGRPARPPARLGQGDEAPRPPATMSIGLLAEPAGTVLGSRWCRRTSGLPAGRSRVVPSCARGRGDKRPLSGGCGQRPGVGADTISTPRPTETRCAP